MQRNDARTLTRYNAWANELIFAAVAALPEGEAVKPRRSVFRNMVHTLNHNFVIDRIFQAHLESRSHGYSARNTPDHPPLAELWRAQQELDRWYVAAYDRMDAARLSETVSFTFVGGGEGAMTRGEILQHLVNHTSCSRVRRSSLPPARLRSASTRGSAGSRRRLARRSSATTSLPCRRESAPIRSTTTG